MKYSVCVIDDKIPASGMDGIKDSDLLNSSNLQLLLKEDALWEEEVIKNLVKTLLDEKDTDGVSSKWEVFGFTNPSFYLNLLENGLSRFDIIIFDWDYPGAGTGAGTDSESILKEILEKTYCLIFIFSGADKKQEIENVLTKPEFQEFKERLQYLDKQIGGADQSRALLQKAEEMSRNNFSFNFASGIRKKTIQIMDKILSELGKATLGDMKNYLKLDEASTKRDLVDFLSERFRSGLNVSTIPQIAGNEQPAEATAAPNNDLIKKIWSFRLYLSNDPTINAGDELVRRGDIVKIADKYYMVISADCDLKRFWHKNYGSINLLPLHHLHSSNTELKEMLTFCVSPGDLKAGQFKHLMDKIGKISEGPFILPFLKIGEDYLNYIAMPKEFIGVKIGAHADISALSKAQRKESYLKYSLWAGTQKICSVSEPFLTAIVQHVFMTIGGFGVPDYPVSMKGIFEEILNDFVSETTPPQGEVEN